MTVDWKRLRPSVWPGSEIHQFIPEGIMQPNGVDISIKRLFQLSGSVKLTPESKEFPELEEIASENNYWNLCPGSYLVEVAEEIIIPVNAIGFVAPRSTLIRMGATVFSGIWDKGFQGIGDNHGRLLLQTSLPLSLHVSVAIAQMIFISAVDDETVYHGNYRPT